MPNGPWSYGPETDDAARRRSPSFPRRPGVARPQSGRISLLAPGPWLADTVTLRPALAGRFRARLPSGDVSGRHINDVIEPACRAGDHAVAALLRYQTGSGLRGVNQHGQVARRDHHRQSRSLA